MGIVVAVELKQGEELYGIRLPFCVYNVVGNVNGLHLDSHGSKLQKIGCPIAISFMVNDSFIFLAYLKLNFGQSRK